MRNPGTHMGVCKDGRFVGSLSGGCIENAVVAEALDALKTGTARIVRFGAGSPYIDINLPCGGGLDIHFQPLSGEDLVGACLRAINTRRPFSLELRADTSTVTFSDEWRETVRKSENNAIIGHQPEPKLLIIGHGATVAALTRLARQMDMTIGVLSPDQQLLDSISEPDVSKARLKTPDDIEGVVSDPWTAIVFLFHDHDWEIALMSHAMKQPHFYLGAMGGRRAHAFRRDALIELGCDDDAISAIHAPIGLFHSSRDPDTLALSTLSQVTQCYHQADFRSING